MKKWLVMIVLLLFATLGWLVYHIGLQGESRVEAWVGSQLKSIVNSSRRFELAFASIDYQAPNRVVLEQMRLSLADEPQVGPLVEIQQGTIELAEIPRWGKPIVLKTVRLQQPTVRVESFIAAAVRSDDERKPTTKPSLSSILTLREVEITDGSIRYDDGNGSPLAWTQLDAQLNLESTDQRWHKARILIDQSPLMIAEVSADIDLDDVAARQVSARAKLDLTNPAALPFFTPPLQRWLAKLELHGNVELTATGSASMKQRDTTRLDASLDLRDAHVSVGPFRLPVERALVTTKMRGNRISADPIEVQTLGGSITGRARVVVEGDRRVDAQLVASRLRLNRLLKSNTNNPDSDITGQLNADIRISSTLAELRSVARDESDGTVWGSGYVSVSNGRLVRIPVIAQLLNTTRRVTKVFTGKGLNRDSFETQFQLIDQIADLSALLYRGDAIGMRGKGRIAFDGQVDLVVNAGPLERLQESLGQIGKAWGKLTDSLMGYSVRGTLKAPIVRPLLGSG